MSSDEIDIKIQQGKNFIRITELRLKMGVSEYQMSFDFAIFNPYPPANAVLAGTLRNFDITPIEKFKSLTS